MFMRALPGRDSRVTLDAPPAVVTRASAHSDQRRRILRALGELVAKRGYADVTDELIVKRAHVSYKTFYKHYTSKEDCFFDLFDRTFRSTERTIRERLDAGSPSWAEQVSVALSTWVELIVDDQLLARAVIVEAPTVGSGMRERYEQAVKAFVPLFRAGREHNSRGFELPTTIEEALAGSIFWSVYQRLIVGDAELLPEVLPEMTELVLRTYLGQAEASRAVRGRLIAEPTAA